MCRHWIILPCQGQPVLDVLPAANRGTPLSCKLLCPSSLSRLRMNKRRNLWVLGLWSIIHWVWSMKDIPGFPWGSDVRRGMKSSAVALMGLQSQMMMVSHGQHAFHPKCCHPTVQELHLHPPVLIQGSTGKQMGLRAPTYPKSQWICNMHAWYRCCSPTVWSALFGHGCQSEQKRGGGKALCGTQAMREMWRAEKRELKSPSFSRGSAQPFHLPASCKAFSSLLHHLFPLIIISSNQLLSFFSCKFQTAQPRSAINPSKTTAASASLMPQCLFLLSPFY